MLCSIFCVVCRLATTAMSVWQLGEISHRHSPSFPLIGILLFPSLVHFPLSFSFSPTLLLPPHPSSSLSLSLSPSISLSISRSLGLSGCHRTCQALMPSNLLPNTHCRLSFKRPADRDDQHLCSSIPTTTPFSISLFLTTRYRSFCPLLKPSASIHHSNYASGCVESPY